MAKYNTGDKVMWSGYRVYFVIDNVDVINGRYTYRRLWADFPNFDKSSGTAIISYIDKNSEPMSEGEFSLFLMTR